jgi:hypothetical protein
MRALTTISILLNLGFIALIIVLLSSGDSPVASLPATAPLVSVPEQAFIEAPTPVPTPRLAKLEMKSVHRSQIEVAVPPPPPARPGRPKPEPDDPSMPLVFQPVDPEVLKLSEEQLRVVDDLQQWFIGQVGGLDQDPNDPGYRERWIGAQSQMDGMTRGMLGGSVFQAYQLAARSGQ